MARGASANCCGWASTWCARVALAGHAIWTAVRTPGDGPNYLELAWALLFMGYFISLLAHWPRRATDLFLLSSSLALAAELLWAAQNPADWWNYPFAGTLLLVVGWVEVRQRVRRRRSADQAQLRR
jgi:hypothetical protein